VFERFTEPARRVVILGQEEARALGHAHIGTEHLLLGLLREDEGVAARALGRLGLTPDAARQRIVEIAGAGRPRATGDMGFTAPARRALESATREATRRGDRHVGTEHLLVGLTGEADSLAARVLVELCGGLDEVRAAVERALDGRSGGMPPPAPLAADPGELGRALQRAAAATDGTRPVDGADLLVGLSEAGGLAAAVLAELGVDRARLRQAVEAARRR
jgi:ATP-dependent Clp protease ATP-binding subunit ClpC